MYQHQVALRGLGLTWLDILDAYVDGLGLFALKTCFDSWHLSLRMAYALEVVALN